MDPISAGSVAARARTENFPVASLLFPRGVRPHLRAVYGYARLVDILGDEYEGDRSAALDELEREVEACYGDKPGRRSTRSGLATQTDAWAEPTRPESGTASGAGPSWEVMRALQPTIQACGLPREPFLRLIEANRMDQRLSAYETWADLKRYCAHSADPVGRLVLGVLGSDGDQMVALSDDVCTGLQLVNFLQDVPRDLELGRVYLPEEDRRRFGATVLDAPNEPLLRVLEFEAKRACGLLAAGDELGRRVGGRSGRAVALFASGGRAALKALERADWDIFTQRPRPSRARLARAAVGVVMR